MMSYKALFLAVFSSQLVGLLHSTADEEGGYEYYDYGSSSDGIIRPASTKPAKPKDSQEDVVYSIEKFLKTGVPFWAFNTSEQKEYMCKMDIVEHANESGAIISRYYLNGNLTKTRIEATFHRFEYTMGPDDTLNEIRYTQEGDSEPHYETLLYESEDGKCGVFFIQPPGNTQAYSELRLKNSAIDEGPSEGCLQQFKSNLLEKERRRSSYDPYCQCILEKVNYTSDN